MAYSPEAGGVLVFGGLSGQDSADLRYAYGDTWLWDGVSWRRLYPEVEPSARYGSAMVWDAGRERILMFGGSSTNEGSLSQVGDTWAFRDDTWTLITDEGPSPRRFAAAAYDPAVGEMILYGGEAGVTNFHDTWAFDGIDWRQLADGETAQVNTPSLGYDALRNELILLGRDPATGEQVTHRWEAGGWVRLEPETNPVCVGQTKLVFREETQRLLVYGGGCNPSGISSRTYEWDGSNWILLEGAREVGPRLAYGLAHDDSRGEVVLYGGITESLTGDTGERGTTWVLKGQRWVRRDHVINPGPRSMFVFSRSLDGDGLFLFGGQSSSTFFDDLWKRSSSTGIWQTIDVGPEPGFCTTPVGGIDEARNVFVVFCANDSSTYEFDGEAWTEIEGDGPNGRAFGMMTWDASLGKMVLYGGFFGFNYSDETWTYDGSGWTEIEIRDSQTPDARILAQQFYDPISRRLIVFGGIGRKDENSRFQRYEDQWYFDGTRWFEMDPTTMPPTRYGAQVVFDQASQRILMFGGKSEDEKYLNDLWAWDGNNWSEVADVNPPAPRMNGRMSWDPVSESVMLYGGFAGVYYSELWRYRDGEWTLVPERAVVRRRPGRR